jgi:hypothetical protein
MLLGALLLVALFAVRRWGWRREADPVAAGPGEKTSLAADRPLGVDGLGLSRPARTAEPSGSGWSAEPSEYRRSAEPSEHRWPADRGVPTRYGSRPVRRNNWSERSANPGWRTYR